MPEYTMTIGGEPAVAAATFGVVNPATGSELARAPECTSVQLDAAFESAAKAQREWRADEAARRDTLRRMAEVLMGANDLLGPILTA